MIYSQAKVISFVTGVRLIIKVNVLLSGVLRVDLGVLQDIRHVSVIETG